MKHLFSSRVRAPAGIALAAALSVLLVAAPFPASAAPSAIDTQLAGISQALNSLWSLLGSLKMRSSGLAQVSGYSSCSASLVSLLGDGCHQMYTDSSGNPIYCNGAMTQSAKAGDTAITQGCSSHTGSGTTTTTTGSGSYVLTAATGLTATQSGSNVILNWTDNSYEEHYTIERRIAGGAWAAIASFSPAGGTGSYQDSGIASTPGVYEYRVKACGGGSCGTESNVATITIGSSSQTATTATTTTTTSTTNTTTTTTTTTSGTSAGLAGSVSGTDIVLTWNDFYTGEDEYQIERRIGTGAWATIGTTAFLAGTQGTYKNLAPPSGTYDYRVRPCTRAGGCTGESNYARVTIGGSSTSTTAPTTATPPPVISAIAATGVTANTATISWITDIPANSKVEYAAGGATGSVSNATFATTHSLYLSGLAASTTYTYSVISDNTDYYRTTFSNQKFTTLAYAAGGSTASSCSSALVSLLGDGCHQMYTDASGALIYCDGPMTKSAKAGDTAVTQGCTSSLVSGVAQCADGKDNDNDGLIDYPQDTSCYSRDDNDEFYPAPGQTGTTTPSGVPASPTNFTAVQSGADVGLAWDDNATNEIEYRVEWYNGADWVVIKTLGILYGGRGNAVDYSPSSQKTHQYRVKACNASGCSVPSNIASIYVSGSNVGTCSSGFHLMSGIGSTGLGTGVGYCMSDADSAVCQPLGGGVSYTCPTGHTATSTPGVVPTIATLTPSTGPIGTRVVINGFGFTPTGNRVNFDSGVIMDLPSPDGKTLSFTVPDDRVPLCAITEPRCLLPAPYSPVKPGTYWVSVVTRNGASGGIPFSVIEREAGVFAVDTAAVWPKPGGVVDTGVRIKVRFTREIDPASLAKEFFRLTKTATPDIRVSGSFSVFPDGFEFVPASEFEPSTGYTYTVLASVRDRASTLLSSPFTAAFTTSASTRGSGAISGSVTDSKGAAVAGAYISVFVPHPVYRPTGDSALYYQNYFARNTKTDAGGTFQLSVPPGTYMVEAHPPYDRGDVIRVAPREVTVAAGETKTVSFTLGGTVKMITGTVLFANGTPVTDAEVGAYASETRQWASTITDAAGIYSLKVGAGQWFVAIHPRESGRAAWTWNGKPQVAAFARDSREETISRNFTVAASNATLLVSVADEAGTPLESAGVVADTHGSGAAIIESGIFSPPEFRITGSDGKAKFVLGVRTYYLRAYIPQSRGYLNPAEQEVAIAAGETKEIKLVFKKKQAVPTLSISGVTKIEEGIAVDAFVWAWSERGGFTSVRAGKDGLFSFGVGTGERWHMGAGKEYKGFPYKSPEIVVEVKANSVAVELLLTKQALAPLPPTVSVSEPGSQQVVAQVADGAQITLPPASAASSGDIKVEIKPTVEAPVQAGTDVVSTVYDVTVRDSAGKEVTAFSKEAEIVIPYSEADLKEQGVSEDALVPSYFDEKTGTWVKIDGCAIDKERNVAVCRVDHLTRFAITARADAVPPDAPSAPAASPAGPGAITVSWKNPAKDFDYAKVYRSAKAGEIGTVRAAIIRGAEFLDAQGLADGAVYYYTVRAVDTAGNESVNTAQVTAVAKGASGAAAAAKVVPAPAGGALARTIRRGMRGDDVRTLQTVLIQEGLLAPDSATGFFGAISEKAVIAFQEKYAAEVLAPAGLTKGSGIVGPGTRKKVNALLK